MRRTWLALTLIIGSVMFTGPAHADCAVIDTLGKLHSIQTRLARDPDTALFATDIRQIRRMRNTLSNPAVLNAVDGNGFTGHGADFVRFLTNTQSLLQGASLDDPQSVRAHFNRQIRENLNQIGYHLVTLRCSDEQVAIAARLALERDLAGNGDAEDLAEVAETLTSLAQEVFQLRTLAIVIAATLVSMALLPVLRRWRILRRRRAKRHNATYETRYRWDGRETAGTLIDINCFGTKLRHQPDDPVPQTGTIDIAICGEWTAGTVMWGNAHYSGVQFSKAIPLSSVDSVRIQLPDTTTRVETQNGAPRGAA